MHEQRTWVWLDAAIDGQIVAAATGGRRARGRVSE